MASPVLSLNICQWWSIVRQACNPSKSIGQDRLFSTSGQADTVRTAYMHSFSELTWAQIPLHPVVFVNNGMGWQTASSCKSEMILRSGKSHNVWRHAFVSCLPPYNTGFSSWQVGAREFSMITLTPLRFALTTSLLLWQLMMGTTALTAHVGSSTSFAFHPSLPQPWPHSQCKHKPLVSAWVERKDCCVSKHGSWKEIQEVIVIL